MLCLLGAAMLSPGGLGLNNGLHAAMVARHTLDVNERTTMMANAHGWRHSRAGGRALTRGLLARSRAAERLSADFDTFLGRTVSARMMAEVDVDFQRDSSGGGILGGGVLGPCRRCCSARQVAADSAQLGRLSASDAGSHAVSEWSLLLWLAAPLLVGKLADEVSTVGMVRLWAGLGTSSLAAANLAWTWLSFTLVLIQGVQQSLYSMVPQAAGAEKGRQVSTYLTTSMLWTCVFLLLPLVGAWYAPHPLDPASPRPDVSIPTLT